MGYKYPQKVDNVKSTNSGLRIFLRTGTKGNMETDLEKHADHAGIGRRLARVRTAFSDLSQLAWAEKHGFSHTQYNNWEKGVRRIPVDDAERLCDAYGLTLDFIYRGRRDGLSETSSKVL